MAVKRSRIAQLEPTGSIEEGKAADFVVVDRNLFDIEPMELSAAEVAMTIFAGEVVYDRDAEDGDEDEPCEWERGERYGETGRSESR